MFGAPSFGATSTGLFSSPSSAFSAPSTTPGFNFAAPNNTGFDAMKSNTGGSLFGGTNTQPFGQTSSLFGTPQSTSAPSFGFNTGTTNTTNYGFAAPATGGTDMFNSFGSSKQGTGDPRFGLSNHQEGNTIQHLHAISAMPAYRHKSFEELRLEDYVGGKRGVAQPLSVMNPPPATNANNLFSTASNTNTLFGAPSNTTSNTGTGSLFGGSSLFGSSNTGSSAFGSTSNLFGAPSASTNFGFNTGSNTGSLFGNTGTGGGGFFGSTTTGGDTGTFNFGFGTGSSGQSTGSGFNWGSSFTTPSTGGGTGLFDFSSSTGSSGSLFGGSSGSSGSSGSLFGGSSLFGTGSSGSSSLFGGGGSSGGSLTSGSLFGGGSGSSWNWNFNTGSSSGSSSTGSLFGGSLWGTGGTSLSLPSFSSGSTGSLFGGSGSSFWGSPTGTGPSLVATINTNPYGSLPSLSPTIKEEEESISSLKSPVKKAIKPAPHYKLTPRSAAKIRPRGYQARTTRRLSLDDINEDRLTSPDSQSRRKLIIDSADNDVVPDVPERHHHEPPAASRSAPSSPAIHGRPGNPKSAPIAIPSVRITTPAGDTLGEDNSPIKSPSMSPSPSSPLKIAMAGIRSKSANTSPSSSPKMEIIRTPPGSPQHPGSSSSSAKKPVVERHSPGTIIDPYGSSPTGDNKPVVKSYGEFYSTINPLSSPKKGFEVSRLVPKFKSPDYSISPSRSELKKMSPEKLSMVKDFTVRRKGYGSVQFLEPVDVRGVVIDEVVVFEPGAVTVYPKEDTKPPSGEGLNCRARVTLEKVWPRESRTKKVLMDQNEIDRLVRRLKRIENTKFENYIPDTGEWTFVVPDWD